MQVKILFMCASTTGTDWEDMDVELYDVLLKLYFLQALKVMLGVVHLPAQFTVPIVQGLVQ